MLGRGIWVTDADSLEGNRFTYRAPPWLVIGIALALAWVMLTLILNLQPELEPATRMLVNAGAVGSLLAAGTTFFWLWLGFGRKLKVFALQMEGIRRRYYFQSRALEQAALVQVADRNSVVVYVNDKLLDVSQYTREEIVGRQMSFFGSGYHPKAFYGELWETIQRGEVWRGTICNKKKSGELIWLDTTIVPIIDDQANPEAYFVIRFDVSEQKRVQEELQARLDEEALLLAMMRYFVSVKVDEVGKAMEQSLALLAEHVGACEASIVLTAPVEGDVCARETRWISPRSPGYGVDVPDRSVEDCEEVVAQLEEKGFRVVAASHGERYAWQTVMRDGERAVGFFELVFATPEVPPIARRQQTLRIVSDILMSLLARASSEQIARKAQRSLKTMADTAPVFIWMTDTALRCVFCNRSWLTFVGKPLETELDSGWLDAVHPEDRSRLESSFLDATASPRPFDLEVRVRRYDGQDRWVMFRCLPRFDDGHSLTGFIASAIDISDRMEMEQNLVDARERALAAARAKADFVANMSHEIRTPMNSIVGMASLLINEEMSGSARTYVDSLFKNCNHLLAVVSNILDFSKIDSGRLELENTPVSMREIIEDVLGLCMQGATEKGLTLVASVDDSVPEVIISDSVRLKQVLLNMISNAVKFTKQGGVSVSVRGVSESPEKTTLHIGIKDTGIGIPRDKIDRLFKPFSQVDASTTRQFGGTGLGLAIVRKILTAMQGQVAVSSIEGLGTEFNIVVPVSVGSASQMVKKRHRASLQAVAGRLDASFAKKYPSRILIAEDNPSNLMLLNMALKKLGYNPDSVENGEEVIAFLKEKVVDVIFMDVQMPVLDGFETTHILREEGRSDCPYIIATTANATLEDREQCLARGMDDFLAKPISFMELQAVLQRGAEGIVATQEVSVGSRDGSSLEAQSHSLPEVSRGLLASEVKQRLDSLAADFGDNEIVTEIVQAFRQRAVELIELLEAHSFPWNAHVIERQAHALKGSCYNVGAVTLGDLALGLEDAAEGGNLEDFAERRARILEVFRELDRVLEENYGGGRKSVSVAVG